MLLIILVVVLIGTNHSTANSNVYKFSVNLGKPKHIVSDHFVSHTIDTSMLLSPDWHKIDLLSPKIVNMCKALGPAYLRFGGTEADYLYFNATCCKNDSNLSNNLNNQNSYDFSVLLDITRKTVVMNASDWDRINKFVKAINWKLLHCLNDHSRNPDGSWNSSNSMELIKYTVKHHYEVTWSLGNEPMNAYNITGDQLSEGLLALRSSLNSFRRNGDLIVAPDIGWIGVGTKNLLAEVVNKSGRVLAGVSFHQYYGNGQAMSWQDFVKPSVLDGLLRQINVAKDVILRSKHPSLKVWITETSSAYNSGSPNFSATFVCSISWADKLGLSAANDVQYVMRQSLFGGYYRLFDKNLDPNPEFWVSVLHNRLMGPKVQNAQMETNFANVRIYAQYVPDNSTFPPNFITVLLINLNSHPVTLQPIQKKLLKASRRYDYYMSPGRNGILSSEIKLNNRILRINNDGTVPELNPRLSKANEVIVLKEYSYGYFVYAVI